MTRRGDLPRRAPPGARPAPTPLPPLRPMLATPGTLPPRQADWAYEVKWDGMRALAYLTGRGPVRLWSRGGREVSVQYPELAVLGQLLPHGTDAILDTEIVALGEDGVPSFGRLQERMHLHRPPVIAARARSTPITAMVFDVLWLSGRQRTAARYQDRRELLGGLALDHPRVRTPPSWEGAGTWAWEWTRDRGLEGVIAKRLDSPYQPGVRSRDWIKVKHVRTVDAVIGGWIPDGPRATACQALFLGRYDATGPHYVGRVGTGFDQRDRQWLAAALLPLEREYPPFVGDLGRVRRDGGGRARWVRPVLWCAVEYTEETAGGRLRHPVWRGTRPPPRDGPGPG